MITGHVTVGRSVGGIKDGLRSVTPHRPHQSNDGLEQSVGQPCGGGGGGGVRGRRDRMTPRNL